MVDLILLYLVIGFLYEMYKESSALAEGDLAPEKLLDYSNRLYEVFRWPLNMCKSFKKN